MLFLNDEVKEEFLLKPTAVHVLVHFVDFFAAKFLAQAEVIAMDATGIALQIDSSSKETIFGICEMMNQMFRRHDGEPTCYILDFKYRLIKCRIKSTADLASLM